MLADRRELHEAFRPRLTGSILIPRKQKARRGEPGGPEDDG
jgi:hypothetical protein